MLQLSIIIKLLSLPNNAMASSLLWFTVWHYSTTRIVCTLMHYILSYYVQRYILIFDLIEGVNSAWIYLCIFQFSFSWILTLFDLLHESIRDAGFVYVWSERAGFCMCDQKGLILLCPKGWMTFLTLVLHISESVLSVGICVFHTILITGSISVNTY